MPPRSFARGYRCLMLCGALLAAAHPLAQERHMHAVQLQRALPEQIAPVLSAQVGPGSSVTPYGNQLILNVTDDELRQIHELLKQLDSAPRSLLIAVRGLRSDSAQIDSGGVLGRWGNDRVQVGNGGRQPRNSTSVHIEQRSVQGSSGGDQQVRALEGAPAWIGSGSLQPFHSGYGTRELVPVERGFYATARVVGDEVVIDVDQRDDRAAGRVIETSGISTQVRGRLGEWIPLGGVTQQQRQDARGLDGYRNERSSSDSDVAIRVELLN